jgi:hypothetical protein
VDVEFSNVYPSPDNRQLYIFVFLLLTFEALINTYEKQKKKQKSIVSEKKSGKAAFNAAAFQSPDAVNITLDISYLNDHRGFQKLVNLDNRWRTSSSLMVCPILLFCHPSNLAV